MSLSKMSELQPQISMGEAASFAWTQFCAAPGPLIGLAAIVTILQFLSSIGSASLQNLVLACLDPQTEGQVNACDVATQEAIGPLLIAFLFSMLALFALIGIQRAALDATLGTPPGFGALLTTRDLGKYVLYVIASTVLASLGLVLCILPGVVIYFLLQLGPYVVIDRSAGVGAAMRGSARLIRENVGPAVILLLVHLAGLLLGGLFMGIPTLFVLPFVTLFTAHVYRQMQAKRPIEGV